MTNLADEASSEELVDFESDDILVLQRLSAHLLPDGLHIRRYGQVVLDHLPRDPGHIGWLPCKHISVCPEEGDEHEFLFRVERPAHLHGLGRVVIQEDVLDWASIAGRNPGPRLGELLLLARRLVGDRRGVHQLYTPHGTLHVDGHRDGALWAWHLDHHVGIVSRHHELSQQGPAKYCVVRDLEMGHVKRDHLGPEVIRTPEGYRQVDLTKRHGCTWEDVVERHRGTQSLMRNLHLLEKAQVQDIESAPPIYQHSP